MNMGQQRPQIRTVGENDEATFRDVTFAGARGDLVCAEVQRVSSGLLDIDKAVPELGRRADGSLSVKVSRSTIDVIAGRAEVVEPDTTDPLTP